MDGIQVAVRRDRSCSQAASKGGEMTATPAMIEVDRIEKHYGDVHAVDGISFDVADGEIFGLLGHNGAGKTTTIRMLTGRTLPTGGTARIAGFDVVHQLGRVKPLD